MVSKTMFETHADDNAVVDQTGPVAATIESTPEVDGSGEVGSPITITFDATPDQASNPSDETFDVDVYSASNGGTSTYLETVHATLAEGGGYSATVTPTADMVGDTLTFYAVEREYASGQSGPHTDFSNEVADHTVTVIPETVDHDPESFTIDDLRTSYAVDLLDGATTGATLDDGSVVVNVTYGGRTSTIPESDSTHTYYTISDGTITFTDDAFAYLTTSSNGTDRLPAGSSLSVEIDYTIDSSDGTTTLATHDTVVVTGTTVADAHAIASTDDGTASGTITVDHGDGAQSVTTTADSYELYAVDANGNAVNDTNGDQLDLGAFAIDTSGHYTFTESDAAKAALHTGDAVFGETSVEITEAAAQSTSAIARTDAPASGEAVPVRIEVDGGNHAPTLGFDQGFANGTEGILTPAGYGTIEQVQATPDSSIPPPPDGDGHYAIVTQSDPDAGPDAGAGPFTYFGNPSNVSPEFVDGSQTEVKVYLNTAWDAGTSFQYTVAVDHSDASAANNGDFLRDFGFQVVSDGNGGIEVGASNGATEQPVGVGSIADPTTVTTSGWYTLQQQFHDVDGVLSVDMNLVAPDGSLIHVATLSNPSDTIDTVGGVRYGWFTQVGVPGGLAVDDYQLGALDAHVSETTTAGLALSTSGAIPFTDTDTADTHTASFTANGSGYVGTFALTAPIDNADGNGDGSVGYTFNSAPGAFDYLHAGQNVVQSYTVTLDDGHGGTSRQVVDVTIEGVDNVAAVHTGGFAVFTDDTQAITPATVAPPSGEPLVAEAVSSPTGGFTTNLLSDTSDADSTLSVDPTSVTFTVLGSNGVPVVGAPTYSLDGTHAFLDTDGTLHVDTTYLDSLNVGGRDQLRVNYTVTGDAAGGDFSDFRVIVVDGTNNAPTLTGVATAEVSEAALSTTTFNLLANVTDVDNAHSSLSITGTPSVTITTSAPGATPTALPSADYSISSAGVLTLAPGAYTDALHYGDHDTITVSYAVSDNNATSPQTVADTYTITLDGSAEQVYGNGTFSGTAYGDVIHGSYGAPNTSEINPATAPAPSTVTSNDTITAGAGDDTVYAGDGGNTLFGNTGNDVIYGGSSSDTISGGAGDDQLHGGNGNDFLEGGAGNDTIDGGAGYNIVTYTQSGSGVNINLYDEVNGNPTNTSLDGVHGAGTDTLSNIQGAYGSAFGDHIQGNDAGTLAAPEILQGQGGDDTIFAGDGVNSIFGNTGNDIIHGGSNNDLLNGGAGNDTIYSSHGTDVLQGGAGIDTINYRGAETAVTVDLTLQGGTSGGALTAQNVYTDNHGNAVTETLSGFENIFGSNHSDTLTGDANANTINGWYGADTINGGGGNDTIFGDHGDDTLFGNAGDDTIHGGQGDDHINGGQGNDTLYGDSGVNTLTGGQGADAFVLYYGDGSTNTSIGNSDTIADFSHADGDKIDLSALAAATQHSITYSGATFSGAADSLIVIQDPNAGVGHYLIEVDINGDGTADFFTHVVGQTLAGGGFGPAPTQTDTASDFTGLTYTPASLDTLHIVAHHDNLLG